MHVDMPGHRDYIKNMIWGGAGGLSDLVVALGRTDAADAGAHVAWRGGVEVPSIVVFLNKTDQMDDPGYWNWWNWNCGKC